MPVSETGNYNHQITFAVSSEMRDYLKETSRKEETSVSTLLRRAIRAHMNGGESV